MGLLDVLLGLLVIACLGCAIALWRLRRTARSQRDLLNGLPQTALTAFDRNLRVTFSGGSTGGLDGDEARTKGESLLGQLPQAQREPLMTHFRAALRGEQRSFEYRSPKTGRDQWVRVVPVEDAKGEVTGGLAVALDISDRRTGQAGSMGRRSTVAAVTDATRELARSIDQDTARIAVCNGASRVADAPVAALFEPDTQDVNRLEATASVGAELRGLVIALDPDADDGAAHAFTAAEETFVTRDPDDGEVGPDRDFMRRARVRSVLWHPVMRDHEPVGLLAIGWREPVAGISLRLQSMIELLGAEAAVAIGRADMLGELERLARTDELTGLPNRRDWQERLPAELARAARAEQSLCVAMLDLDRFKDYNDNRGHQAGDQLLTAAATAWLGVLRPYDVLARYGGEEFSLLLPDVDLDDAVALIERLREATPEGVSCSAGVAAWDGEEDSAALVGRADAALYDAKRAGRNRVSVATRV
jgi:diguanylate cyclase (GGDEF)-like protein